LKVHVLHASTERELEQVFTTFPELGAGGIVFTSDPFFANRSQQLATLAARHRVPTVTQSRDFTTAGGLVSYGGSFVQSHRQAGVYIGRILKGEKASDLPVQQVTKVELFINLRTAKALGLAVSSTLLAQADEVIE
jgi:putative tryptophan/tyrosine transport system substrate-binding protein